MKWLMRYFEMLRAGRVPITTSLSIDVILLNADRA